MSTRANIVIKNSWQTLWFYRHSDGYPSEAGEHLKKFLRWLIDGRIRDNPGQAAGWLIVMGKTSDEPGAPHDGWGWKVGDYEPTDSMHGDIEYLYIIDLVAKTMQCCYPPEEYDAEKPPAPFYTVTADNIELPIEEHDRE